MKTNLFKRTGAILVAIMLVLAASSAVILAIPAALPDPDAKGSIVIHKFILDDLSDATLPANGLEADSEDIPDNASPLGGITFSVIRVEDDSTDPATAQPYEDAVAVTGETNSGGVYTFGNLDQGIYKVTEISSDKVGVEQTPFLVSIPITDPINADNWIYDVHVYPKNQSLTINKFVNESDKSETAYIGQPVPWNITPSIPADVASSESYEVVDVLDSQLTYIGNVVVNGVNGSGTKTALLTSYYSLTEPTGDTGGTLKIEITAAGLEAIASYKSLSITFDTFINSTADLGTAIYNGATLNYTNNAGVLKTRSVVAANEPEVHTGGVLIEKVAKSDNTIKLSGAKFKIALTEEDALDGVFLRLSATGDILLPTDDDYDESEDWVKETAATTGQTSFDGLAYGSYYLVETKAPFDAAGKAYNLLKEPVAITVNAASHLAANKVVVENSKGFVLPLTGGDGTTLTILIDILLIAGAITLFIVFRPEKQKK